jgi:hypothetical protein
MIVYVKNTGLNFVYTNRLHFIKRDLNFYMISIERRAYVVANNYILFFKTLPINVKKRVIAAV